REVGGCPAAPLAYNNGALIVRPPNQEGAYVPPDQVDRVREQLSAVAEAYGDEDVDVLDVCLAKWTAAALAGGGLGTVVRIGVDDILYERGVTKKLGGSGTRGGYRPEERERIWEAVCRLRSLFVQASEVT